MKRKLVLTGFVGFAFLFGCSQVDDGVVQAGKEGEFTTVYTEGSTTYYKEIIKHENTGCFYLSVRNDDAGGVTQMFIEKDGVSVPYCE